MKLEYEFMSNYVNIYLCFNFQFSTRKCSWFFRVCQHLVFEVLVLTELGEEGECSSWDIVSRVGSLILFNAQKAFTPNENETSGAKW